MIKSDTVHSWVGQLLAGLVAACLTVGGSFLALYFSSDETMKLERKKLQWQKDLEREKFDWQKDQNLIDAAVDLSNKVVAASYENGSFLESVKYHPDRLDALFDQHEEKMKELMGPVVSAHAALAALDDSLYKRFRPLVNGVSDLDACLTKMYRDQTGAVRLASLNWLFFANGELLSEYTDKIRLVMLKSEQMPGISKIECNLTVEPSSSASSPKNK